MKTLDKIRVAVLFGGRSIEHEVSLLSAINVIENLDPELFEVVPIGIDKQGNWLLGKDVFMKSLQHKKVPLLTDNKTLSTWFTPAWVGKTLENHQQIKDLHGLQDLMVNEKNGALFDVVFPVMHGAFCEDGSLQGLLELANLPYVGAGVLGSAICMDKDIAKRLAISAGVKVAPYIAFRHDQWLKQSEQILARIHQQLQTFPLFVKPANTGSSIGISKIKSKHELAGAIDNAFQYDHKVLVEQGINARELEVAVLEALDENDEPIVSVVGEITTQHEFYSYTAKYFDEQSTTLSVPAKIAPELQAQAQLLAKTLFQHLECSGMARVDMFLDKDSEELYFNEINTIPGFTCYSMYPKLMAESGMPYAHLLKHLIELAIKKHNKKTKLIRSYEE